MTPVPGPAPGHSIPRAGGVVGVAGVVARGRGGAGGRRVGCRHGHNFIRLRRWELLDWDATRRLSLQVAPCEPRLTGPRRWNPKRTRHANRPRDGVGPIIEEGSREPRVFGASVTPPVAREPFAEVAERVPSGAPRFDAPAPAGTMAPP